MIRCAVNGRRSWPAPQQNVRHHKDTMAHAQLYGKREVRTAAYNRSAAHFFLQLAEHQEDGEFYSSQGSLVFSAFTHEAFLNALGTRVIKDWAEHECESPQEKLKTIAGELKHAPAMGKRPYQTLKGLIRFRNLIAHGREERVSVSRKVVAGTSAREMVKGLETEWQKYCTKANARQAYDDVRDVAVDLCTHAGLTSFAGFPFGSPASGFFRVKAGDA